MSKVFVIGAAGKVGQRLLKNLGGGGHEVIALHRKEEQSAAIKATGAIPLLGNLTELDASRLSAAMTGSDVVVFTAGAGGAGIELTKAIDGKGLRPLLRPPCLPGSVASCWCRHFLKLHAVQTPPLDSRITCG